ncbi:hypothetical protein QAD02_017067 [Eretmocerus hayati]|uniref:Uncharacterized protein n=1 Tax=Eretmocerus hayati TaxID=131215 RepID=A0ACC2PCD7_9HYME|nr:hypothetical protein QAD02_017067 [Eretmocerus hayati]
MQRALNPANEHCTEKLRSLLVPEPTDERLHWEMSFPQDEGCTKGISTWTKTTIVSIYRSSWNVLVNDHPPHILQMASHYISEPILKGIFLGTYPSHRQFQLSQGSAGGNKRHGAGFLLNVLRRQLPWNKRPTSFNELDSQQFTRQK